MRHFHKQGLVLSTLILAGCLTDTPSRSIEQSYKGLRDSALSNNGQYSLVASNVHGASVWRLKDSERLYNWNHMAKGFSKIEKVALAGNGNIGLTALERELVAWNSTNGKSIEFWELPAHISCLSLNQTGSHALVGMASGQAMLIDIQNNGFIWQDNFGYNITACALSANNQFIALGTQAGVVKLFQVKSTTNPTPNTATKAMLNMRIPESISHWNVKLQLELEHAYAINHVNILPKNQYLVSSSQHNELWINLLNKVEPVFKRELKRNTVSHSVESDQSILLADTNRNIDFLNPITFTIQKNITIPKRNLWNPARVYISSMAYAKGTLYATGSDGQLHFYDNE